MIDDLPLNIVNVGFHSLHWPPMAQGPGARAAWVGGTLLQGAPLAEVSSPLKVRVSQCALLCPHGEERHLHMAVEQSSAAVLHHLWNWEDAGATRSSIFLFPPESTGKQREGKRSTKRSWEHLCGVRASLTVPATGLCPGKGRNMWKGMFIHLLKSGFLCLAPTRGERVERAASPPLPSLCPHTRLERNIAFSFPLRSAGKHRLLQSTLASEAVSCFPAPACLLACGSEHERKGRERRSLYSWSEAQQAPCACSSSPARRHLSAL